MLLLTLFDVMFNKVSINLIYLLTRRIFNLAPCREDKKNIVKSLGIDNDRVVKEMR